MWTDYLDNDYISRQKSLYGVEPLKQNETCATGLIRPKTTSLFFDRLWVPFRLKSPRFAKQIDKYKIPEDFCMPNPLCVDMYEEAWICNSFEIEYIREFEKKYKIGELIRKAVPEIPELMQLNEEYKYRTDHTSKPDKFSLIVDKSITKFRNAAIHELVLMYAKNGIRLTPIFLTPTEYDKVIEDVDNIETKTGLEICLDFIPDIIEDKLEWEQVREFRQDKKAKQKLNRLRYWFNIELLNKSEEEICNILGQKLDDYTWALKKHGIQTAIGGLTSILSFTIGSTFLNLLSENPLASLSGGIAIGSGTIAWISTKLVERADIKRSPIAYIYEVRKRSIE